MVPQELVKFRKAIHQLEVLEPTSDRRSERRYSPLGPLSRARVIFDNRDPEDADVIDLSYNGLRLAVSTCCRCQQGDRCTVELRPDGTTLLTLDAEVRWVKSHPFITVFGVLLDPDDTSTQPV